MVTVIGLQCFVGFTSNRQYQGRVNLEKTLATGFVWSGAARIFCWGFLTGLKRHAYVESLKNYIDDGVVDLVILNQIMANIISIHFTGEQ